MSSKSVFLDRSRKMDIDATQAIDFDIDEEETCENSSENKYKPVGYLLLHEQKGLQRQEYPVFEGDNIIGRHESCHICIPSTAISKEHACIVVNSGCHLLFDKGSRNKSKRDKLFLTPEVRYELKHNDELTFGDVRCTYTVQTKVSVKDGGSGSETEEEVEKEGDEEDYASDASSDILQPTQPYEDGVLINASNPAHQDKSSNLDAHPRLPEEDISVMETPEFLKKVSRAYVTVTGTLVLPESESETEDELPPETLLFEDSEGDVKALKKMANIEATQGYRESDDEDSDSGDHVDLNAATQAMGLGDDMTLDEENKPKSSKSKQGRVSPGKQKPAGVETAGVLETQVYSMDTQEDHEDSMDMQNKRDVLDENKNNSYNQIKSADLAAMETQAMEDKDPDTTEENPDHLSELFCTSTLAFASDDEMDEDGKDKVDETVHFDDATQAIDDSFLSEDPDDKKESTARFVDEMQAIDDGCTPVKEKKKSAAVHFDNETQVIGGLAVDDDKTQAVGEEDATQAVDDDDATQAIDGDDATQAIDGDDATQAIDGDDATQAVADDASHAVSVDDATQVIRADTAHTGHLPRSAACRGSREVTSADATQPIDDATHSKKKNTHASATAETVPMDDTLPVQCSGSETVAVEEDSTLPISSSVAEEKTPMKGKKGKMGTRGHHLVRDKSAIAITKFGSEGFNISWSASKTNPETSDAMDLECGGDSTPEIAAEKVTNTRDIRKLVGAVEESLSGTFLPQVVTDGEISPSLDATQEIVPESQDVDQPSTAIIKLPEKSPLRPALVDLSSRKRSPSPSPKKVVFADTIKDANSERELVTETEHSTVKLKGTLKTAAAEKLGTKRGRGRKSVTVTEESGAVQHQDKEKTQTALPAKRGRGRGRRQKDTGEVEDKTAVSFEEDTSEGITVLMKSAETGDKLKVDNAGDSNSSPVTEEPRRSGRARKARREYSPTPETDDKSGDTSLNSSSVESKKKDSSKKKGGQPDDSETEMVTVNPNRNVDAPPSGAETAVPDTGHREAVAAPSGGNTVSGAPEKKQKPVSKGARSRRRSTAGKGEGDITRSDEETFTTGAVEEADAGGSKNMSVKVGNFVAAAEDKASEVEAVEDGTAVADMDSSKAGAGNEVAAKTEDNVSTRKSNKDIEISPVESLPATRSIASRKTKRETRSQVTSAEEEEAAGKADDGNEAAGIGGEEKTQTAADQSAHTSSRTARTGKRGTASKVLIAASKTENAVSSRRKRNYTTVTETKQSARQLRNSQDSTEDEQAPVDTDGDFKVPEPVNDVIDELLHTSSRASRSRRRGQSESEKTQRKTTAARTSSLENEETAVDEREASVTDKRRSSLSSKSAVDKKKLTGANKNKESNADDEDKAVTDECKASSVEKTELLATENKRQSGRNKVRTSAASRKRKSSASKDEASTIEEKEASTTEGNDALGVDDSEAFAINELEISTAGRRRVKMARKNATSKIETKAVEKEDDDARARSKQRWSTTVTGKMSAADDDSQTAVSKQRGLTTVTGKMSAAGDDSQTAVSKQRGSTTVTGKMSAAGDDSQTAVSKGRKTTTPRHSLTNSVASDIEESTAGQSKESTAGQSKESTAGQSKESTAGQSKESTAGQFKESTAGQSKESTAGQSKESTAGQSNDNVENDVESKPRGHSRKRKTEDKSDDSKPSKRASKNTKSAEEENDASNSKGASESSETPAEKEEEQKLMTGRGKGRSKRQAEEKCSSPAPSKHARHNSDEPQMICLQNGSPVPTKRSVKDENSVSSPSLRRSTLSSKPKVLFTGVIDEQGQKMVKDLGGDMAQSIEDCTHIITDKIRRTVKFLGGLARGVSIVTHQWLESSKSAGTFVDASLFLVQDPQMEKQYKFNLVQSIQKASQSPLLQGYRVHVTKSVRPEPQQMKEILTCAGAEYLGSVPSKAAEKMVVISCDEDGAKCNPAIKAGVPVVSAEFILTGILRQEVDVESFRLFGDQSSAASGSASSRKRR